MTEAKECFSSTSTSTPTTALDDCLEVCKYDIDSQAPTLGSTKAAGYDLYASERIIVPQNDRKLISTGIKIKLPHNTVGIIKSRSGLAVRNNIDAKAGVIDEDYRGIVKVVLHNSGTSDFEVNIGDRIAQLLVMPILRPQIEIVNTLNDTERGEGGFGSTGTN